MKQFFEEYGGVIIILIVVAVLLVILGNGNETQGLAKVVSDAINGAVEGFTDMFKKTTGAIAAPGAGV